MTERRQVKFLTKQATDPMLGVHRIGAPVMGMNCLGTVHNGPVPRIGNSLADVAGVV